MVNEILTKRCRSKNLEVRHHWEGLSLDGSVITKLALNIRKSVMGLIDLPQNKNQWRVVMNFSVL
jgi:hypothetical protein